MTKEYAALIAQVIPVFALGLGLQMRELTSRLLATNRKGEGNSASSPSWALFLAGSIAFGLAVLASLEQQALAVVKEVQWTPWGAFWRGWVWQGDNNAYTTLNFAIIVTFMAPAFDGLFRLFREDKPRDRDLDVAIGAFLFFLLIGLVIGAGYLSS